MHPYCKDQLEPVLRSAAESGLFPGVGLCKLDPSLKAPCFKL